MLLDGTPLVRRSPFLFIGNGEYQAEGLDLGARSSLDGAQLSAYIAPECGRVELLMLPARALAGRLSQTMNFERFTAREISVEPSRSRIGMALDGEIVVGRAPLRCRIRPRALRLLAPGSPPGQ